MSKKIKRKYKKDDVRSSILVILLVFYIFLSLFMVFTGNTIIINITKNELLKVNLISYMITMIGLGIMMLVGAISGIIGLFKLDLNQLLFSIVLIIISTILFVVMDGYYSVVHNIFSYFNYFINVLACISSSLLLIVGYKHQEEMMK